MKTLIIAPHPDDEILGAGGTLLRKKLEKESTAWLIVTGMNRSYGYADEEISRRNNEIAKITKFFDFDEVHSLQLPPALLDTLPISTIVKSISDVIQSYEPDEVLVPHRGDVHTDHYVTYKASISSSKWFRHPSVKRILCYETLSETGLPTCSNDQFSPNVFVEITSFLDKKIEAMEIYSTEVGVFPFPRSKEAIEALARYRGSASGYPAAEAFQLINERS